MRLWLLNRTVIPPEITRRKLSNCTNRLLKMASSQWMNLQMHRKRSAILKWETDCRQLMESFMPVVMLQVSWVHLFRNFLRSQKIIRMRLRNSPKLQRTVTNRFRIIPILRKKCTVLQQMILMQRKRIRMRQKIIPMRRRRILSRPKNRHRLLRMRHRQHSSRHSSREMQYRQL